MNEKGSESLKKWRRKIKEKKFKKCMKGSGKTELKEKVVVEPPSF